MGCVSGHMSGPGGGHLEKGWTEAESEEGLTRSGDWPMERSEKGGSSDKGA